MRWIAERIAEQRCSGATERKRGKLHIPRPAFGPGADHAERRSAMRIGIAIS